MIRERAEFVAPAVLVGSGPPHRSACWSEVPYRRQVWLRGLTEGTEVAVLDDYGNVFTTTVRAVRAHKNGARTKEPQVWLAGHGSSYSAARIWRVGRAPLLGDGREVTE